MTADRISRDDLFMSIAYTFSRRSTCLRGQVGAVIVRDRRIISTGYNGAPPGRPHCNEVGCEFVPGDEDEVLGCQRTVHAEANAIVWAARAGIKTYGTTMYCTYSPCRKCAELMAAAGVLTSVWDREYRLTPWSLLSELGITEWSMGSLPK